MDDRFLSAWITRRDWRVCGRRLQPLCSGHLVNLHAVDSPLLPGADDLDLTIYPGDLLLAVRICTEGWPFPADVRPRLRDVLWRWRMERNPRLFRRHLRLFTFYMRDHTSFPVFWEKEADEHTRTITAPAVLSKVAYLISETNISEERAWSMPLARLDYTLGAVMERKTGAVRFWDDAEAEDPTVQPEESLDEPGILDMARGDLPADLYAQFEAARRAKQSTTRPSSP